MTDFSLAVVSAYHTLELLKYLRRELFIHVQLATILANMESIFWVKFVVRCACILLAKVRSGDRYYILFA